MKLLKRSLYLDFKFLFINNIYLYSKFLFIIKKYLLLAKNFTLGFKIGKSYINILGRKYFYNDNFGIAFLQSVYVDNAFLLNFINHNSIIVDIGANIGQFNFFCKNFLKALRVYSFEPVKDAFNTLQLNSPENTYNYAISSNKSEVLYVPKPTNLMASSIKKNSDDFKEIVNGIRLDDVEDIKNEKFIDLLKIDTEGSELDVVRASIKTMKKSRYILVETSINRKSSGDIFSLFLLLKNHLPRLNLVFLGRLYTGEDGTLDACDVLFFNCDFNNLK